MSATFIVVVSVMWFVAVAGVILCFGDPDSPSPLGRAAYFLSETFPRAAHSFLKTTRLLWVFTGFQRFVYWFLYKRHPIIQIAYVLLVVGCYGVFVVHGYPLLPNKYMAGYHRYIGAAIFAVCCVTFILASFTDPGVVTADNLAAYQAAFPYDNFMYEPKQCTTCKAPKVARSKHSRATDRCVVKFDHYCIWLANDIGVRNYRWFLLFLIANSALLLYGAAASVSILADDMERNQLMTATFVNKATGEKMPATWGIIFQYFMYNFVEIMMILCLAGVMGVILTGFTMYHFVLASFNTTTNESYKWREAAWHREKAVKSALAQDPNAKVVAMPPNIYDKGLWGNLSQIIWPPVPASSHTRGNNVAKTTDAPLQAASGGKKGGKQS